MDGNRRDSGCRPFFAHAVIRNLSGGRRVFTDESHQNATCPVEGGFSRTKLPSPPYILEMTFMMKRSRDALLSVSEMRKSG